MMAIYGCSETQGSRFWSWRINGTIVAYFMTLISSGKHLIQNGKIGEQAKTQAVLGSNLSFGTGLAD